MTDENQTERFARMRQAQRQKSARDDAVNHMLEAKGDGIEDRLPR